MRVEPANFRKYTHKNQTITTRWLYNKFPDEGELVNVCFVRTGFKKLNYYTDFVKYYFHH